MEGFFYFYHMSEANFILFDGADRVNFLPLTFTRPMADLRIGILTIREKWEKHLRSATSTLTEQYLQSKHPLTLTDNNIWINSQCLPNSKFVTTILSLKTNQTLLWNGVVVAYHSSDQAIPKEFIEFNSEVVFLNQVYDLFRFNEEALQSDFDLITAGRKSEELPKHVRTTRPENIFVEPGAQIGHAVLNASTGPIYIGKNAEVMDGCLVRGGLSLSEGSVLKMGAKIYGPTTIGPYCKVGGEVNNAVFLGYYNKGHDGFLGNSVIGEWCNLGADTNTSNLKNNYEEVKLWNYKSLNFAKTGLQFCGLILGDHSKCGINTMFNTGTVVVVSANIFGSVFPRNFVPSFSWGGHSGFQIYNFAKAMVVARAVMARRGLELSEDDENILKNVFDQTANFRSSF